MMNKQQAFVSPNEECASVTYLSPTPHSCMMGDRCLIDINATVADGTMIGENSMVAGHSIATELSISQAGSIIAGVPRKPIRTVDNAVAGLTNAQAHCQNAKSYVRGICRVQEAESEIAFDT